MSPMNISSPSSQDGFLSPPDTPNSGGGASGSGSGNGDSALERVDRASFGATGYWSHGLFGCFSTIFTPLFWSAFLCTPCLYGQLMQRLGLTCTGMPTFHDRDGTGRPRLNIQGTCTLVALAAILVISFTILTEGWLVDVAWYIFVVYLLFMGILLRSVARQYFGIGPACLPQLDGMAEDCLVATFCSCCSGIQIARHTHNEDR